MSASYLELNAKVKGKVIDLDADREAVRRYFRENINRNVVSFDSLEDKFEQLTLEGYYEAEFWQAYDFEFIKSLRKHLEEKKFRFTGLVPALKFYSSYALKTFDGERYLERYEDRILAVALYLGAGDETAAADLAEEMIEQRYQPATPTFLNAGRKQRGEMVSCFLIDVQDDLNSIYRAMNSAAQLSKRGGGVAVNLSNIRPAGAPIKQMKGLSSGVIPVMKVLEDTGTYVNQLGQRQGAIAVYLNAHHMDIQSFLDSKRENADEKIRMKTLNLGVVIPDITVELAARGENMYLFDSYDVERVYGKPFSYVNISEEYYNMVDNRDIRKKHISARDFFQWLAEVQFNSGYPYVMFEDTVNRENPIDGKIIMSNLCSEILQVQEPGVLRDDQTYAVQGKDISCNLGSLNIKQVMDSPDFGKTVEVAIRALTEVSDKSDIRSVPSIDAGNKRSHAVGLGQMNLHGYLASKHIHYGSPEALAFIDTYAMMVTYHAIRTSMLISRERGSLMETMFPNKINGAFEGFEKSKYADGSYFDKYINIEPVNNPLFEGHEVPTAYMWRKLRDDVMSWGMYNQNLQAIPPTGSISYVNNSVPSILPATARVETRKEGKLGRVNFPAPGISKDNFEYYKDAYEYGNVAIIDTVAAFQKHVDQGISNTLFFTDEDTTEDINRMQAYAHYKGAKCIYYVRVKTNAVEGTDADSVECESCSV